MKYFISGLKKYAVFSGRDTRTEYWMYVLFNFIFAIVAMILDNVLHLTLGELPYGVFYFLYALVTLVPSTAIAARRLHDVSKSGWFMLIALIPLVGAIWLLVLLCTDSDNGANEYGPNPKGIGNEPIGETELQPQ